MYNFDSVISGSFNVAQEKAIKERNSELTPEHLLWGLYKNPASYSSKIFKNKNNEITKLLKNISKVNSAIPIDQLRPSSKLSEWLTYSSSHAIQAGRQDIKENDILRFLPKIIPNFEFDYSTINEIEDEEVPNFLINLNDLAREGKLDPVIGRTKEIRAVMEILGRRTKNNPVLVGDAGVGKTAIIEGLAEAIVKGNVPEVLKNRTIYSLELGSLMAGTKFRGEFEERIQSLIKYVRSKSGEVVLFIDEIHQLVGAGRTDGAMDAANLLKPALARGELNCIGATTLDEYQKYILGDSALDRRFRGVKVNEPSKEDAIEILMGIREKMEIHHGIKISDDAIYQSVILSDQYITNKHLPDKAIDLIDEASAALKISAEAMPSKLAELESEIKSKRIYAQLDKKNIEIEKEIEEMQDDFNAQKIIWEDEVFAIRKVSEIKKQIDRYKFELEQAEINQDYESASKIKYSIIPELSQKLESYNTEWVLSIKDIALIISRHTGIPTEKILRSKHDAILKLENYLNKKIIGQEKSIKEISETLITSYAGLSDRTRPLGSFLLQGPSGVGKTETAKMMSKFLFESTKKMIRLDMSEFSEKHSIAKLIGAPAGYIGHEDGGVLTEAVRRDPYSIILFDEIEKAHHNFSDILLQILDDGRLTDSKGRTIDFKNTVIILTSNSKQIELDLKPEVIGRIDSILTYNSLNMNAMTILVEAQTNILNKKLEKFNLSLLLSEDLTNHIARLGYDERYGARPLQNVYKKLIIRPLSTKVISESIQNKKLYSTLGPNSEIEFSDL